MRNELLRVTAVDEFELLLEYENGEQRRFDMKPLLVMKPWTRIASRAMFALVRLEYGTAVWPGNVDVAPETLYLDSVRVEPAAVA
jgi:hypothetical protein